MVVNRSELKACMARNSITRQKMAQMLGISTTTLLSKLDGKSFNEEEISALSDIFNEPKLFFIHCMCQNNSQ